MNEKLLNLEKTTSTSVLSVLLLNYESDTHKQIYFLFFGIPWSHNSLQNISFSKPGFCQLHDILLVRGPFTESERERETLILLNLNFFFLKHLNRYVFLFVE